MSRLTLAAMPYKVKPGVPRWRGWRLWQWGLVWREECDCDAAQGCVIQRDYGDAADFEEWFEPCECDQRPPHTHTRIGMLGSRPLFFPNAKAAKG